MPRPVPPDPSEPQALGPVLERLYRRRFSEQDLDRLRPVWGALVAGFFQRRIPEGATVLDLGAGACLFINAVRAARRIALDANPELPRHAAAGVETVVSDDLSLAAIPPASLDVVFVSNFLEHLGGYREILSLLVAIRERLRPGGSLMVLQPNFRLEPRRYFDFLDHRVVLTDASLREAVEVVGFEVAELRARFLPFTSKSRLPQAAWAVRLYLLLRPAQWLLGRQSFLRAVRR